MSTRENIRLIARTPCNFFSGLVPVYLRTNDCLNLKLIFCMHNAIF